jgi:two-component system, chemotaxis family, protein-glutamate methylesterase/glutaminase
MAIAPQTPQQVTVLIVDDSAFMRKALQMMLESDPNIKVVGQARDGEEGVEKVKRLKPDLVTMDIEMPRMDGLTALREIMANNPTPVMMVSSLTSDGAKATLDALDLGAVDFIPKETSFVSLNIVKIKEELLSKIKDIARRKSLLMSKYRLRNRSAVGASATSAAKPAVFAPAVSIRKRSHQINLVAIGSSTGGPPALQAVISKLPRNFPVGIVVAQHMPPKFTASLAERLNGISQLQVKEAVDGDKVEPGVVLIAPGGKHILVKKYGSMAHAVITDEPKEALYHPCVDVLMNSVAEQYLGAGMAVILTGMGNNGVIGSGRLKSKGGIIIAQNEETCIVYGMPRAVIEAKIVDHVAPIDSVAAEISSYF